MPRLHCSLAMSREHWRQVREKAFCFKFVFIGTALPSYPPPQIPVTGASDLRINHFASTFAAGMSHADLERPMRVLALDGGGVRGLSSLLILRDIMDDIGDRTEASETPMPCEYFDLIGGTCAGGLIAIMLGLLGMVIANVLCKILTE